MANGESIAPAPARKTNRGWIWYFAILAVLTAISVTILIRYNLAQQLTPQDLQKERDLWEAKGPASYDLEYTQTGNVPGTFKIRVRRKRVVSAIRNGEPLPERQYSYYSMSAWFDFVGEFLKQDAEPGKPRTYAVAYFDPNDGHLLRYIRRVMGTSERLEVNFHLEPITSESDSSTHR